MKNTYRVIEVDWSSHNEALLSVRIPVFVDEQLVPLDEEVDDSDPLSVHVLAYDIHNQPVGTGRLTPKGWIGRMAVLKLWRGKGVGLAILKYLTKRAESNGFTEIRLSAQTHAIPFYERLGFKTEGSEYDDCDIPHIDMVLKL